MKWKLISRNTGFLDLLLILAIFLGLFFFFNGSLQFGFVILLFLIYTFASKFYFNHVMDYIDLKNEKIKIKCYQGDTASVKLHFSQPGLLPIVNGELTFELDTNVSTTLHTFNQDKKVALYKIPFQISKRNQQIIEFDIKAENRGVARLKNISIRVENVFGIGYATYEFNSPYFTEIIVYPTLQPVKGIEKIYSDKQGVTPNRASLYDELTMPVGTRNYSENDPFNRINWKASARTNQLQTKVYEKTNDLSWTIMLNVMEFKARYSVNIMEKLEETISQIAYIAQVATHLNIPFSLAVNFGSKGKLLFVNLEKGEGRQHLVKTLELLAYINDDQPPLPMRFVTKQIDRKVTNIPIVILFGEATDKEMPIYEKWERRGTKIHHIQEGTVNKRVSLTRTVRSFYV